MAANVNKWAKPTVSVVLQKGIGLELRRVPGFCPGGLCPWEILSVFRTKKPIKIIRMAEYLDPSGQQANPGLHVA